MHAEATRVRIERGERRGAADVRQPRTRLDGRRGIVNRGIGHAQQDEIGRFVLQADAALAQGALMAVPTRPWPTILMRLNIPL